MTVGVYDKGLLEMTYNLTKERDFLDSIDVAKRFKIRGKKISDRTIRRYFGRLDKECFDYFPHLRYEALGLLPIWVLIERPYEEDIFQIIPYHDYVTYCYSENSVSSILVKYAIPAGRLGEFKEFWKEAKKGRIVRDYQIYPIHTPIEFYSPFHKVVKRDGTFDFSEKEGFDNTHYLNILRESLKYNRKPALNALVLHNPFIIPVLLEYYREHYTNRKVWKSIKSKLGENVWSFLKKNRKKTDGVGYFMVQRIIRSLNTSNYSDFFQHIKVFYDPFMKNGVTFYVVVESEGKLTNIMDRLSKNCLITTIYPFTNGKGFMLYNLTSGPQISHYMRAIHEFDPEAKIKFLWRDPELSSKYFQRRILKLDYSLFNPETMTWSYDQENYLKILDSLIKSKDVIRARTKA
jgi:hypothetical protein